MESDADSEQALSIATAILVEMDKKQLEPVLCYAALGCAFIQLHKALGHSKEAWIEHTKVMSEVAWE